MNAKGFIVESGSPLPARAFHEGFADFISSNLDTAAPQVIGEGFQSTGPERTYPPPDPYQNQFFSTDSVSCLPQCTDTDCSVVCNAEPHRYGQVIAWALMNTYERVKAKAYSIAADEGREVAAEFFEIAVLQAVSSLYASGFDSYNDFLDPLLLSLENAQMNPEDFLYDILSEFAFMGIANDFQVGSGIRHVRTTQPLVSTLLFWRMFDPPSEVPVFRVFGGENPEVRLIYAPDPLKAKIAALDAAFMPDPCANDPYCVATDWITLPVLGTWNNTITYYGDTLLVAPKWDQVLQKLVVMDPQDIYIAAVGRGKRISYSWVYNLNPYKVIVSGSGGSGGNNACFIDHVEQLLFVGLFPLSLLLLPFIDFCLRAPILAEIRFPGLPAPCGGGCTIGGESHPELFLLSFVLLLLFWRLLRKGAQ